MIFNGNKNIIFQNRVLGNLLFKTDTIFLKIIKFGQTQVQILHKYDSLVSILISGEDNMYLVEFFARN